jgi:ABC-type sugar transport system permease subunit
MAQQHAPERSNAAGWWHAVRGLRQEAWGDALAGYLFVGPAVLLFFTFNAYPVLRGLMIAFSDYRYLLPDHQPFNGIDNWVEMVGDTTFLASLARSYEYTLVYFVMNFAVAFLAAVLISQIHRGREAGAYRVMAYLPVILPIAIAMLVWRQLLSPEFGYVSFALKSTLGSNAPDLLRTAKWAIPILAIVAAWKTMGTNVLLLLVGLYNINQELYEAAAIDGAGWWRRLFHITIPLLRPTFTIIFVLAAGVLGGGVEESLVFFGVTDAGPEGAGRVIGRYAYEIAFREGDLRWGYAAAMNLTVGLMSMAISAVVFRALRSGRV